MRSLSIRSVLGSLIAASLVVASAPVCMSSFGVSSGTPTGKCFVREIGSDFPDWRYQGTVCDFESHGDCESDHNPFYDAIEDCLRVERERYEREEWFESIRDFASEFNTPRILHDFHASNQWIGRSLQSLRIHGHRTARGLASVALLVGEHPSVIAGDSRDHLANIYVFTFESNENVGDSDRSVVRNAQQAGMDPVCSEWQTTDWASVQPQPSLLSNHDSCFAESTIAVAEPARPPRLESDLSLTADASSKLADDLNGIGHCAYLPWTPSPMESDSAVASLKDMTLPDIDASVSASVTVPSHIADAIPVEPRRNMIESWLEPNWDIHRWTIQSTPIVSAPWRPYRAGSNFFESNWFCMESRAPRISSNLPIDPAIEESSTNDAFQITSETIRDQFESWSPWIRMANRSIADSIDTAYQNWKPLYLATRQHSARLLSGQMKQWGMFFLDSASRIDSNIAVEMAGREYSQR